MWGINENIKFNNLDINLKINLGGDEHLFGYQQEIDNLTEITKEELINPIVDGEIRRYVYNPYVQPANIIFYFYSTNYSCSFINAGFVSGEIANNNVGMLNSFFIMELYDTYDPYTQTKISTNYLTKILGGSGSKPDYTLNSSANNQFYYLYIPISFLNKHSGATTITGYTRFSFYNSKTGKISLFYNSGNVSLLTPEKMYFKTQINLNTKSWQFIESAYPYSIAMQILPTNAYAKRINNTIDNTENKKQNYPSGYIFDQNTGTYITE